ncbi:MULTISPECIES: MarR family winged helix-turn-helix transcriptional regulator [Streptomyces]|uniref:MarR family transcriptional regulator n=1 Tax=Streptomyces tsukubensis (strain DSM 42081 / NBRC 108919 / NRRL 18488 / 9993) TaxID=1114943 RepID=I2N2Y2_STRT9|nr:helix-turn-helix domain-containing protein [Streptomyces tsukubensis]MYS62593.1 MarR family transcriptional regulator [Streptomyces sp. SID5473]AZK95479.1 MarR family transcriptional regulator [Streptomyces tsukubensis]EIF91379.1 MarR family transcriptional regulator [Streptomyces tsukubensis NRRL18488]QKM68477.1 MarR family transcriptional regulator [Streptomyces tsukubensis NRRL18488]TAI43289.1 MarR family transcriptional regulator [Streptomyces tsukubensis]
MNGPDGAAETPDERRRRLEQQALLTRTALGVFRLNGHFIAVSERIAKAGGLTAASWQVLGAVARVPQPVSALARAMGLTRQSVQRTADLLVDQGLAVYRPNPAHRRAKLLSATADGRAALGRLSPGHATLASYLAETLGPEAFAETAEVLERLSDAMAAADAPDPTGPGE